MPTYGREDQAATKIKNCTRWAVPVGIAEQLAADCYRNISITEEQYTSLAAQVEATLMNVSPSAPKNWPN